MTNGMSGTDVAAARRIMKRIHTRRGTVYVAVLGVALIVSVIGLAAMHIARIETRAAVTANDMAHAQLMAQSAIEYALGRVELAGSSWRTTFVHGEEVPPDNWIELGHGQLKFVLLDDDGDLADDGTDRVTVRGIGRAGGATSVTTLTLAPAGSGLDCLEAALHSQGVLNIDGATVTGTGFLSSTTQVLATNNAGVYLDAECVGNVDGSFYFGQRLSGAPPRTLPDPATVFEYYLANGTAIPFSDIAGGSGIMDRIVLTREVNPFGATNAQGIYVIDCQGNNLVIQNSRLEATLVLVNAGSGTRITSCVYWQPAAANFPAMLVQGNMEFNWNTSLSLDESLLDTNFNPPGAPIEGYDDDSDKLDSFPTTMKGLAYVTGSLSVTNQCQFEGVVLVGGTCTITDDINLVYREVFLNAPPPGFAVGDAMRLVPGTWTRAAY